MNVAKNSRSPREDDGESQRDIGMWDSYFVVWTICIFHIIVRNFFARDWNSYSCIVPNTLILKKFVEIKLCKKKKNQPLFDITKIVYVGLKINQIVCSSHILSVWHTQ